MSIQYVKVRDSNASGGAPVLALASSNVANNVDWVFTELGDVVWTGDAGNSSWTATANWNLGRAPLPDDPSITIPTSAAGNPQPVLDLNREFNGRLTVQADATLTLNGRNLTINGAVTNAGTLTATGTETLTCRSDVDFTGGSFTAANSTLALDGTAAQSLTLDDNTFHDVLVANVDGSVTITDGFTANDLTVRDNTTAVTFQGAVTLNNARIADGTGTVTFDTTLDASGVTVDNNGADVTFSGALTSGEIAITNTSGTVVFGADVTAEFFRCQAAGPTLRFEAGQTVAVTNLLLRGQDGSSIVLRSSAGGSQWNLNVSGWHAVRYVDVQDSNAGSGSTIYAIESVTDEGGNNANWNFGAWSVWNGSVSTAFGTADNWTPSGMPGAGASVLIDGGYAFAPIVSAATEIGKLVVGIGVASTLTVNTNLTVAGDVLIMPFGTTTHSGHANPPVSRVELTVRGDLAIDAGGQINVTGRGWSKSSGPGYSTDQRGGSHGGKGWGQAAPTYGSVTNPVTHGSGGRHGPGGGVVRLNVDGTIRLDGRIESWGRADETTQNPGAGGSVFIHTGALFGSGTVDAGGGVTSGNSSGGGRIAVILTNSVDFGSVAFKAYGGNLASGSNQGGAGTIYLRRANETRGRLIVDNANYPTTSQTQISHLTTDTVVGDVILRNSARLRIAADQSLTVHGSWTNAATFTADAGSTVTFAGTEPATIWNNNAWRNLTIATPGKTVSFEAGKTQTVSGTPTFDGSVTLLSTVPGTPWNLTVPGTPIVDEQPVGRVNVRDSDASAGKTIKPIGGKDLGDNLNWIWPPPGTVILMR